MNGGVKMKKFSALLLALAMVFSLAFAAGCQQQKEAEEATAPSKEATAPSKEATAPSKEATAPSKEATAPSEENATGGYGTAPAPATGGYGSK